jgi:acetyl-CoA carboxylase beta subunit
MEKYYEKKAIRNGAMRKCKCGNVLSRYNQNSVCSICEKNSGIKKKNRLKEILDEIG